jgi:hypothetical protein
MCSVHSKDLWSLNVLKNPLDATDSYNKWKKDGLTKQEKRPCILDIA